MQATEPLELVIILVLIIKEMILIVSDISSSLEGEDLPILAKVETFIRNLAILELVVVILLHP